MCHSNLILQHTDTEKKTKKHYSISNIIFSMLHNLTYLTMGRGNISNDLVYMLIQLKGISGPFPDLMLKDFHT